MSFTMPLHTIYFAGRALSFSHATAASAHGRDDAHASMTGDILRIYGR